MLAIWPGNLLGKGPWPGSPAVKSRVCCVHSPKLRGLKHIQVAAESVGCLDFTSEAEVLHMPEGRGDRQPLLGRSLFSL